MRLRTKLFITWGSLVVLLWAGTLWPVQRAIKSNFERVADEAFAGMRRSLSAVQAERLDQMRQACRLIMNIPELRALIAEERFEISEDNLASLRERLNALSEMVGADAACVLDTGGGLIAQSAGSPWSSPDDLHDFVGASPAARALVLDVLGMPRDTHGPGWTDACGLWVGEGRLFQVVGVPLVFEAGAAPDGALFMATAVSDRLASDLAAGHNCEVSFLAADAIVASSLGRESRSAMEAEVRGRAWAPGAALETEVGGERWRAWFEVLNDPASNEPVGAVLVQSSLGAALAAQARVSRLLLAILATGLLAAAVGSYLLSGAVTRPVAELLAGVRKVAAGDIDHSLRATRGDELGALAEAFNEMLAQLRSRRELQRLVEESQAASRAKSRFLATMSHEIRTPLNGVVGMADLLMTTRLDERQRRYAATMKSSAEVLTTLINDVLDLSKIEAGRMELESIEFDPREVVENAVELMAARAFAKGLEVVCEVAPGVPERVVGDPTRVRQILINFLSNAVKFTARGEIVAGVNAVPAQQGCVLRFWVTDTGIGIPSDRRGRLFESFSQADASTTRKYGGTGLGLAISRQLAELMGGAIGVESEEGVGSTFWFTAALPAAPGRVGETELARRPARRVLVVEPNARARTSLITRLAELGAEGEPATAAELLSGASDDGRGTDGAVISAEPREAADVARALRARPGMERARLVLVAGPGRGLSEAEALGTGFDALVSKPVRRAELAAALDGTSSCASDPAPSGDLPPPRAHKGKILLADDQEVNQIVVSEIVTRSGFTCDIASDGQQAVDAAAAAGPYDLILMDCQMPVLDGVDATRAIREHERRSAVPGGSVRRVPIIALTANAMSGDRQRCLDSGMDAFCTKPIDAARLIATIESLLTAGGQRAAGATEPALLAAPETGAPAPRPAPPETADPPLDFDSLIRRCSGKSALASRVAEKLVAQADEAMRKLGDRVAEGDAAAFARVAHALKGTAGMASAEALRDAAARAEALGRAGDLAAADRELDALREEVRRCREFVRAVLEQPSEPDGAPRPLPE